MAKTFLPLCGATILGLAVLTGAASAASLPTVGRMPAAAPLELQAPVETVGWRQVCRPVPRWFNGRQVFVERCRNVWVEGRGYGPGYGSGYGGGYGRPAYGPPPGPAYGYGGPYRGGPGYY